MPSTAWRRNTRQKTGPPFGHNPDYKWDLTQRFRERIVPSGTLTDIDLNFEANSWIGNSSPWNNNTVLQTSFVQGTDSYPQDKLEGNDDLSLSERNPYVHQYLSMDDSPSYSVKSTAGQIGDTVEERIQFTNFVRGQIGSKWYRFSDYQPWRFHPKLKKVSEAADNNDYNGDGDKTDILWINNVSEADTTNNGW